MRILSFFISLLITSCAHHPLAYRVEVAGANLVLVPPNTRISTASGQTSIDVLDVIKSNSGCAKRAAAGGLEAEVVKVALTHRTALALRFKGNSAIFQARAALEASLQAWWQAPHATTFASCHGVDGPAIRRSLLAQRPMNPADVLEEQFALRRERHDLLRTVLLRPGMRVCATDVEPDRSEAGTRLAGTHCARLVGTWNGGAAFEPSLKTVQNLVATAYAYGTARRVSTWVEIQRPQLNPHLFVLIQPQELPESIDPVTRPGEHTLSIVAAIKVPNHEGAVPPGLIDLLASHSTTDHEAHVKTVCSRPDVLCFTFGERGTITADFRVQVNGAPIDVGVGATLGDVLSTDAPDLFASDLITAASAAAGVDVAARRRLADAIRGLTVRRFFEGRLVPVDLSAAGPNAQAMPLLPGDRIAW